MIGVIGSGDEEHHALAEPVGTMIAELGADLLTGGGAGVMTAVSRAFSSVPERQGLVVGIVPGEFRDGAYRPRPGYPNRWVDIAIFTHLPLSGPQGLDLMSRNHINVLSSDVLIALPGGEGTRSEIELALQYDRPLVAYLSARGDIPRLPASVRVAGSLDEVRAFVTARLKPPTVGRR